MRFLIDENLPYGLVKILRDLNHEVLDVAQSELRGAPDEALWKFAAQQPMGLVTRDLDFPLFGLHPYPMGLVLFRVPDTFPARTIEKLFADFLKTISPEEMAHHITVLLPGRVRYRKL